MRHRYRPVGALILVLCVAAGLGVTEQPAWAADYPSWEDVQAAKANEATKKAEIAKLQELIAGLETEAARMAKSALVAAEAYNQATVERDEAAKSADALQATADAARARADASRAKAGAIISQLSRSGGDDLTAQLLLSGGGDVDDLLYRLGTLDKLSQQSAALMEQATRDSNAAKQASAQAAIARAKRENLADEAEVALTAAQKAADEAAARVADQDGVRAQLYAQLASLKGTTASVEQGYQDGLAWEAAQNAVKDPPPPPPPVNPPPPAPNTNAVAEAIAFAQAQVGDPYVINGTGPNGWDCAGLTKASYAAAGVNIGPHGATSQYNFMAAASRLVPFNDIVAGDLLFYSDGGSATGSKYHVALYIGDGKMIEAPYPGKLVRVAPIRYGDLVPYAGRPTP